MTKENTPGLEEELAYVEKVYPGFLEQFLDAMEQGTIDGRNFDNQKGGKCFYGHLHTFTKSTEVIWHEAEHVAATLAGDPDWTSPVTDLLFGAVSMGDTPATNRELLLLKQVILSVLQEKGRSREP